MRGSITDWIDRHPVAQFVLALLVVVAGSITLTLAFNTDEHGKPSATVSIKVAAPGGGTTTVVADRDNSEDPGERHEARVGTRAQPGAQLVPELTHGPAAVVTPDVHEDSRDETPGKPGVENGPASAKRVAPGVGKPQRLGGAQGYSCPPHYVVNQSALNGRRSGVALHFTVSPPGSLDSIRRLFNTPSFGASSTFGIELAGRCETWVPPNRKSWAQGAFNSAYESIEIVTYDLSRAQWLAAPIIRNGTLANLVRDRLRANGAPLRHVDPGGCTPKAGVTDHDALECGNVHWDVGTHFPWDVFMRQLRAGTVKPITTAQRKRCGELNGLRRAAARRGWHDPALTRANKIKAGEAKRGLRCLYPPRPHRLELVRG